MTLKEYKIQEALGLISIAMKRKMAQNPNTPVDLLKELYMSSNIFIKEYIKENPKCYWR